MFDQQEYIPLSIIYCSRFYPEKDRVRSLSKDSFSPFDSEKHRQKLADMKKSPEQPEHLYSARLKRVFAEVTSNLLC